VTEATLSRFLRDANAFVASSHEAIKTSAPHIYLSALLFAAKDSLVYQNFAPFFTSSISATATGIERHSRLVATLAGHEATVGSVAYSPDDRLSASGSADGTLRIWDTRTGEEINPALRSDDSTSSVHSVAFSPNGQRVIAGINDAVHVWSILTGRAALPPLRGHSDLVSSVKFSVDGTLIASGSCDKTVRLWGAETGLEITVMSGHTDRVTGIAFSPDGQFLASASDDQTIRFWHSHNGEAIGNPLDSKEAMSSLCFSPDGKWLAAGSTQSCRARVWDIATLQPTSVVISIHLLLMSISFSPDGLMLVLSGNDTIQFWDLQSGRGFSPRPFTGHSAYVRSLVFSQNGQFLASGSFDGTVKIWDTSGSFEFAIEPRQEHRAYPTGAVAVSSDGTLIVSGLIDGSICIWDAHTGYEKLQSIPKHHDQVLEVTVSPNGRLIASASADHTVRLWDVNTGESVGEPLRGHEDKVWTVAFSADARWLASGSSDETVCIWDVATRQMATFGPLRCTGWVISVSFSPDGRLFAAADHGGCIHFWRVGTDELARTPLQANSYGITSIEISPDSMTVVAGGTDNVVRVWDIAGGFQVFALDRHLDYVYSVAYSPDGRYIVSASRDHNLILWDAQTGVRLASLIRHSNWVAAVTSRRTVGQLCLAILTGRFASGMLKRLSCWPKRANKTRLARLAPTISNASGLWDHRANCSCGFHWNTALTPRYLHVRWSSV